MFTYQLEKTETGVIVHCAGDIDIDAGDLMEEQLEPLLQNYLTIALDLHQVQFVDSSGIGLLIKLVQDLQEQEREVWLERIQTEVMEVFELLQLSEILGKGTLR